ncbi:hypothetical protein HN51_058250, partial [Arachis hypogaea]
ITYADMAQPAYRNLRDADISFLVPYEMVETCHVFDWFTIIRYKNIVRTLKSATKINH